MNRKIAYLCHETRHPYHDAYARSIGAKSILAGLSDKSNKLKNYFNSLKVIACFPYRKFDAILTDGPDVISLIIKRLSLNRIKLISTQANNHLYDYFFYKKYLNKKYRKHFKKIINEYDLIVCLGEIQFELAKKICSGNNRVNIVESYNGVSKERQTRLSKIAYKANSQKIISLSNQGTEYLHDMKGLDIMLSVFSNLLKYYPNLEYYHIGPTRNGLLKDYKQRFPHFKWDKIHFVGAQYDLENWFSDAVCMFHLSRKDSFPVAVTEAFSAGLPVFVGHRVGLHRMFNKVVEGDLFKVNVFNEVYIIENVVSFLELNIEKKERISGSFKQASKAYTQEKALEDYKNLVQDFFKKEK